MYVCMYVFINPRILIHYIGYHILESYKDRICASLPDDYNNTALRLQTLIGASDHMIQWILTGDMSKANHRIYQVVLVFVCFEPHFIKFCDIMEVLADGSMTVLELRKSEYCNNVLLCSIIKSSTYAL